MSPLTTIVLLWLGFAGSHLLLSTLPVRRRLVTRMGEQPFRGLYSLVAFAFFVPLVLTYFTHTSTAAPPSGRCRTGHCSLRRCT